MVEGGAVLDDPKRPPYLEEQEQARRQLLVMGSCTEHRTPMTEQERRAEYIQEALAHYNSPRWRRHCKSQGVDDDYLVFDPVEDSKLLPDPPPIAACSIRFRGLFYLHLNFVARSIKNPTHKHLLFAELRFTPYLLDAPSFVHACTLPLPTTTTTCAFCPPARLLHPTNFPHCGNQQHKDELDFSVQNLNLL
ncbi:Os06g0107266 [Oryza sativa Japonica Group]|uniref:DUF3615 domain-containing protein n=2 Tax=Oryza sativa subsp. japonica TaxID=39947 RepID=B9FR43_ORYSJ|nr:hypothetical protein OsJ_19841 [Oryza sativa Japonica Group]BAA85421.1 hypothetical protein [Oryza sativa Japonica Group]BAA90638.1 hypothetical protein [Oryza sativa Japonica Group]BAS95760.1 Os06g0107266 [Oryza sativa Japonica Group]